MPKLVLMSDIHQHHHKIEVPDGDIVVVAGDFSLDSYGKIEMTAALDFFQWLGALPHETKVLVAGNHDFVFQQIPLIRDMLPESILYLEGTAFRLHGLNFWGGPWTPRFYDWAFNVDRGEAIKVYWDRIPDDTDVLVTHGPPHGILDIGSWNEEHLGCEELLKAVERVKPRLHVFGHIHPPGGKTMITDETIFVNASVVDEQYKLVNEPVVITLT